MHTYHIGLEDPGDNNEHCTVPMHTYHIGLEDPGDNNKHCTVPMHTYHIGLEDPSDNSLTMYSPDAHIPHWPGGPR
ncbi:hypothetical protein DPMN_157930 [Dreissena polymorpha]|uniref:Uncharacterized protein n=1 Tax=Dreissena polymorpha TaxID=45954 RepID=A0A9D4ELC8_DREPO|nr:hypothetical protein DPMN_157930 [Dreissena polymorpha]